MRSILLVVRGDAPKGIVSRLCYEVFILFVAWETGDIRVQDEASTMIHTHETEKNTDDLRIVCG